MSKKDLPTSAPTPPVPPPKKPATRPIHIVGLVKNEDRINYHVVTGTTEMPVIDRMKSPLQYAAQQLEAEIKRLIMEIP